MNAGEKKLKLSVLTIGSSHTGGAGVGTFLSGHPTLKVRNKGKWKSKGTMKSKRGHSPHSYGVGVQKRLKRVQVR